MHLNHLKSLHISHYPQIKFKCLTLAHKGLSDLISMNFSV